MAIFRSFLLCLIMSSATALQCFSSDQTDLVFVLDSSGSICDPNPDPDSTIGCANWQFMREFIIDIIRNLRIGANETRVGLVRYDGTADTIFNLNSYYTEQELVDQIAVLEYIGGDTNTSGGLREMHFNQFIPQNGDRPDVPNTAVVITDGISTIDSNRTIADAEAARNDDIRIIVLGITEEISEPELKAISSPPQELGTTYFLAANFSDTASFIQAFTDTICFEPPEEVCVGENIDLVFVLDSSGSIRDNNPDDNSYDNWKILLDFVKRVVDTLEIGPNATRVGLVRYSGVAESIFYLNSFDTKADLRREIDMIDYVGSDTNTSGGLREMHRNQFQASNGDRPGVPNTAIVITDGVSTIDQNDTIPAAEAARADDIRILVFGITESIDERELRLISSQPQQEDETYFIAGTFEDYADYIAIISRSICENDTQSTASTTLTGSSTDPTSKTTTTTESRGSNGGIATVTSNPLSTSTPFYVSATPTSQVFDPSIMISDNEVTYIYPTYGPRSGGTRVTLIGQNMNDVINVLFTEPCDECNEVVSSYDVDESCFRRDDTLYFLTQPVQSYSPSENASETETEKYRVLLQDRSGLIWDRNIRFQYRPDPVVLSVRPNITFISGGIKLTITGRHFTSTSLPALFMNVVVHDDSKTRIIGSRSYVTTDITILDDTTMFAFTPNFMADDELKRLLSERNASGKRRKRRQASTSGVGQDCRAPVDSSIGIRMDERESFTGFHLLDCLPEIEEYDGTKKYDRNDKKYIDIKGSRLTSGASEDDYSISLGEGRCRVSSLLDNRLDCKPPKNEPDVNKTSGAYRSGKPKLIVYLGKYRSVFVVGHVNYVNDNSLIVIIACCLATLLIVATVTTVCFAWRRHRKRKLQNQNNGDKAEILAENNNNDGYEHDESDAKFGGRRFPEIHESAPDSTGEWAIERPNGRSELNGPEGESTRSSHVGERGLEEEGSNGEE